MKIAIAGTRGIPNKYGGFEQFAQEISVELNSKGHDVTVFSPACRNDGFEQWNNIKIKKVTCPSLALWFKHFIYDFLSIHWAIKQNFDIIVICGYVTSFPALWWHRSKRKNMVILMDGMEWKRKKWNFMTRRMIKIMERWTCRLSSNLVVDHPVIQEYYKTHYHKDTHLIAYGCRIKNNIPMPHSPLSLAYPYFIVVARYEPENQLELVCRAFLKASEKNELLLFTNKDIKKYHHPKIHIILDEYNDDVLNFYRQKAKAYIHAYTVGGTNPSLIEAMAYCPTILAFDNAFHRFILKENAFYFKNEEELVLLMQKISAMQDETCDTLSKNRAIVLKEYQWEMIADQFIHLFNNILHDKE